MPCKHEYSNSQILIAEARATNWTAIPRRHGWASEMREKHVRKQKLCIFFFQRHSSTKKHPFLNCLLSRQEDVSLVRMNIQILNE